MTLPRDTRTLAQAARRVRALHGVHAQLGTHKTKPDRKTAQCEGGECLVFVLDHPIHQIADLRLALVVLVGTLCDVLEVDLAARVQLADRLSKTAGRQLRHAMVDTFVTLYFFRTDTTKTTLPAAESSSDVAGDDGDGDDWTSSPQSGVDKVLSSFSRGIFG